MLDDFLARIMLIFIGVVIGWVLHQYRLVVSEKFVQINEHIEDIKYVRDSALDLWLSDYNKDGMELSRTTKIRAAYASLTPFYPEANNFCSERGDDYQKGLRNLFSSSTGGSFESTSRKIDPQRVVEISIHTAELIHILRLSKSETLLFRSIFKNLKCRAEAALLKLRQMKLLDFVKK